MDFEMTNFLENKKLYPVKNYKVLYDNGKWSCSCKGFLIKKKCKHVTDCQKLEIFETDKIELQNNINALVAEFQRKYPTIKKIYMDDGIISILL